MPYRAALVVLVVMLLACDGPKPPRTRLAAAAERTVVSLGTATPGGGFPVYGDALVATIATADPSLDIRPRHTQGSTENVPLLERGELDLALVQGRGRPRGAHRGGRPPADGVGRRLAGFTAVAKAPEGARFIALSAEEIRRIQACHAFLQDVDGSGRRVPRAGKSSGRRRRRRRLVVVTGGAEGQLVQALPGSGGREAHGLPPQGAGRRRTAPSRAASSIRPKLR